jgi:hypothetical protein
VSQPAVLYLENSLRRHDDEMPEEERCGGWGVPMTLWWLGSADDAVVVWSADDGGRGNAAKGGD